MTVELGRRVPSDDSRWILGMRVDALTYAEVTRRVLAWACEREHRYVCVANVHMVMEAYDDTGFREIVNEADLVTSDGVPLVWALRALGVRAAERVYGPELTLSVCAAAQQAGVGIGFIGSSDSTRLAMIDRLRELFPGIRILYSWSPPFGQVSPEVTNRELATLRESGASIIFVGLGCPKQERWMRDHLMEIEGPMLGVGAAFDFIAGKKAQAPSRLQALGLEWLFRLVSEPRRLWWRYFYHNPRFLWHFARQYAKYLVSPSKQVLPGSEH